MIDMTLPGPVKPYVRMTQRSRYANVEAREYLESRNTLKDAMRALMLSNHYEMFVRGVPLYVMIRARWCRHNQDLDNIVKAVLDAGNGIIYEDDCWIDAISAYRSSGGEDLYLAVWPLNSLDQGEQE